MAAYGISPFSGIFHCISEYEIFVHKKYDVCVNSRFLSFIWQSINRKNNNIFQNNWLNFKFLLHWKMCNYGKNSILFLYVEIQWFHIRWVCMFQNYVCYYYKNYFSRSYSIWCICSVMNVYQILKGSSYVEVNNNHLIFFSYSMILLRWNTRCWQISVYETFSEIWAFHSYSK